LSFKLYKMSGLNALYRKARVLHPAGSVKDRIAKALIDEAEARGLLKPAPHYRATSAHGESAGLSAAAEGTGSSSPCGDHDVERRTLKAYGRAYFTESAKGMKGAIDKAAELASESQRIHPRTIRQSANRRSTGKQRDRRSGRYRRNIDIFVAASARSARSPNGEVSQSTKTGHKVVAVEPLIRRCCRGAGRGA
jgi:cysteine synthase A